jgi:hypothetical protein
MAGEDIAAAARIARLALKLCAGSTFLAGLMSRIGCGVDFGGICYESQRFCRRITGIQGWQPSASRSQGHQV